MLRYPVSLKHEDNAVLVSFPDFPGANTFGDNEPDALRRGADALVTLLAGMIEDREAIPNPRLLKRGPFVVLPALTEAKIALYEHMRSSKIGKAELARRLKMHLAQVDRLLDLRHASRLDQLERAFLAIGKRLKISLEDAA
jgi:antitoxin HicB